MVIGTASVIILYFLCNVVYLSALSRDEIAFAANDRVAVAAAEKIMGNTGTIIMAVLVMISTFGCINGLVLSGARVFQTMAKDGLFLAQLLKTTKITFRRNLYGYKEYGLHYCALAGNMEISGYDFLCYRFVLYAYCFCGNMAEI